MLAKLPESSNCLNPNGKVAAIGGVIGSLRGEVPELGTDDIRALLDGIATMQGVLDRYEPGYLEHCYDTVFRDVLRNTEMAISSACDIFEKFTEKDVA